MKTTLLIAILTLGLLPGLSSTADAQPRSSQIHVYIGGYQHCGTPIYKMRYVAGYDRCGNAIWHTRVISHGEWLRYQRAGCNSRSRHSYSGYYGPTRIRYSTSSGRGYSYNYHSRSNGYRSSGCRSW